MARKKSTLAQPTKYTMEQLLHDAYYGTGGFEDGSYLIPHRREGSVKFDNRKLVSYYLNYVQAVVNSHVDPVFNQPISRDWGENSTFDTFSSNIDCDGSSMNDFMKSAGLSAKLKGVVAIVVDNFPDEQQPVFKVDALKDRIMPYAFLIEKEEILGYSTDRFGRLTSFAYKEPVTTSSNMDSKTTSYNTITWTNEEIRVVDPQGKETIKPNPIGRVPVTLLKARKTKRGDVKPPSEFGSIAKTNLRIFNLCSELDEILRNQAFSILIYPGQRNMRPAVPKPNNSAGTEGNTAASSEDEVSVSTDNMLGFPPDASNPPAYIAPPAEPSDMLMNQIDRLIKEIYRMAVLSFVTGVQESKTGVAKQWDFEKTNQVLADFAGNCEKSEKDIAEIFKLWTQESFDYEVKYPDDFGISDILEALEEAAQALALQVGGEFNRQVKKKIAALYFADLPDDEYDALMADLDAQHQAEEEAKKQDKENQDEQTRLSMEAMKVNIKNGGKANPNTNQSK